MLLLKELLLEEINLTFQVRDALSLLLSVNKLSLSVFDLILELPDVLHLLLVVDLSFLQG